MTRREELEHRAATHCRECLATAEKSSTTATAPGSISGRCATPATSRPRLPRPSPWSFTTGAATTSTSCCATSPRWALLSAGRRAKSSARTATTRAPRARQKGSEPEAHAHGQGRAKGQGQGQGRVVVAWRGRRGTCRCPACA